MLLPHKQTEVPASRNPQSLTLGSLHYFDSVLLPHLVVITMAF